MTEPFRRYAVYFTPPPGPWADLGAAWLGWDVARGRDVAHPAFEHLPAPAARLTETPRKYGFHATLKPPMRLAEGKTPDGLAAAVADLAARAAPVRLSGLQVAVLGHFVALTPVGGTGPLNALAGRLVTELDAYRAPPAEAELARRRKAGLSAAQEAMLQAWGYPYVLDQFRFHMTLSGRLPPDEAAALRAALAPRFARVLPGPVTLDAVTLVGEGADGRFREIQRYSLKG